MAKEEWGTKRICPETGKRFYDLNNNPVISPYTGKAVMLDKSSPEKVKSKMKSAENKKDAKFEESDELLSIDDDLILDEEDESSELDDAASYISSMNGRPNFLEIEYSEARKIIPPPFFLR